MKDLRKISIVWGLVLFAIFAVLTFFALKWKSKNTPYFSLEDKMVKILQSNYEGTYGYYPTVGQSKNVTLNELRSLQNSDELTIKNEECDGYVRVYNNKVIEYKAYIKCKNYTTKDYEKFKSSTK